MNLVLSDSSKQKLNNTFEKYEVFTTRPDTIYGVTYTALAPEHKIVKYIVENKLLSDEKIAQIEAMQKVTERDRATKEKEGIDLEITVIHPLTGKRYLYGLLTLYWQVMVVGLLWQ